MNSGGAPGSQPPGQGRFVTFEGIEGTGKSTQISLLVSRLRTAGVEPVVTREPGGTELGRQLRRLLLAADAPKISPHAELLLYATDRAQHLQEVVRPALGQGRLVLCDRYVDATMAYQGYGRELGIERIRRLHREPALDLVPHRTLLLDLEAGEALERARGRNRNEGLETAEGRFEAELLAFHERVRAGYLELAAADRGRFRVVPAGGEPAAVARRVAAALADMIPMLSGGPG